MATAKAKKKGLIERLPGDKMVWIIVLMLCLISLVSIFSSTSQLASQSNISRINIAVSQFGTIAIGLLLIFVCCLISSIKQFERFSKYGFLFSLILLLPLALEVDLPFLKAPRINGAFRTLVVFKISFSVFEIVKVAMVMYTAWAVRHVQKDEIIWIRELSKKEHMSWISKQFWVEIIYLFLPAAIIGVLTLKGSTSSAMLVVGIMLMTMLLGRINIGHMLLMGLMAAGVFALCFGMYSMTKNNDHPLFRRVGTAVSRTDKGMKEYLEIASVTNDKKEYYNAIDKIRQPYGAKIAIKEGGFLGKGPGQSTQKYKVSIIYEDFMFSFIVEEYGLWMAFIVLVLYTSLLARGSLIIKNCKNEFAKIAVAGLCLLITGQAMFHIIINCDVNILTGQTLPMISHGTTSFFAFSIAFGIIISISRMAEKRMAEEIKNAGSLIDMDNGTETVTNKTDEEDLLNV